MGESIIYLSKKIVFNILNCGTSHFQSLGFFYFYNMDIYSLSRNFWNYSFENPEKIKPNHIAMYFFAIEHCNRLGWKEKFGFPTTMVMDAISIKSYNTFIKTLNDLIDYGFIKMVEKSKNQYSSNIIALSKICKANDKALDKAIIKHSTKQSESTVQSIDSIDIPIYNNTNLPIYQPTKSDIDFDALVKGINDKTKRKFHSINKSIQNKYLARLKEGYTKKHISTAIKNAVKEEYHINTNYKYLTPEFFSRSTTLDKYADVTQIKEQVKEQTYAKGPWN